MTSTLPAREGGEPVRSEFLVFGRPQIAEDEINEIVDSLRSGWIGTGPKVKEFEARFADYVGVKHAVAVSSCTAALHLSLLALGIGEGDEVITTPLTFAATANAIVHTGARPVFADVDVASQNISCDRVAEAITDRTKSLLPVHFAGYPCDMTRLTELANGTGVRVIEDAAHCIEGTHAGQHIGSISATTCFSFYVTKNLTTIEGGMVTTDDDALADDIRVRSLHGMSHDAWARFSSSGYKHYQVTSAGFKYNMTDIQAGMGLHQLERIEANLERRREVWERYEQAFADLPVDLPQRPPADRHALHLYTIFPRIEELSIGRDDLMVALQAENIGVGIHYLALHRHPFYRELLGLEGSEFPGASWLSDRTISLPLSASLTSSDVDDVITAVTKVLRYYHRP